MAAAMSTASHLSYFRLFVSTSWRRGLVAATATTAVGAVVVTQRLGNSERGNYQRRYRSSVVSVVRVSACSDRGGRERRPAAGVPKWDHGDGAQWTAVQHPQHEHHEVVPGYHGADFARGRVVVDFGAHVDWMPLWP